MPQELKNSPNSKEFDKYLKNFMKRKVRQHRRNSLREVASSVAMILTV